VWCNPFREGKHGDRAAIMAAYREHLEHSPALKARLGELRGQVPGVLVPPAALPRRHSVRVRQRRASPGGRVKSHCCDFWWCSMAASTTLFLSCTEWLLFGSEAGCLSRSTIATICYLRSSSSARCALSSKSDAWYRDRKLAPVELCRSCPRKERASRGFLPWRLPDAGPEPRHRGRGPASVTLHSTGHCHADRRMTCFGAMNRTSAFRMMGQKADFFIQRSADRFAP
jgi:hypothetical protein